MVVTISSSAQYTGTITPSGIGTATVIANFTVGTTPFIAEGYIDTTAMEASDVVTFYENLVVISGAGTILLNTQTYSGTQNVTGPLIHFTSKLAEYGYQVVASQSAGTVRALPYQFFQYVLSS